MTSKAGPRPGGRSARVQAAVHTATKTLLGRLDRGDITIPMIAAEASVTPSTIYRRWGGLPELLADIALERLRPDTEPSDTGDATTDLRLWAEQYAEEISSGPGREMIRDVLSTQTGAAHCCSFTRQQIELIASRARGRGEAFPDSDRVLDHVVSPIVYRTLFDQPPCPEHIRALVTCAMAEAQPISAEQPPEREASR